MNGSWSYPGTNRTGVSASPIDSAKLVKGAEEHPLETSGSEKALEENREDYARESAPIGTMPPPASLKGLASTVVEALKGSSANVLLDKMGERLAFERTGTRLYDAVLSKLDAYGSWDGGPTRDELEEIRDEELRHFHLLRDSIAGLGADPTAMTPSADLAAVLSMGVLQAVTDPRTDLAQTLEAIKVAELTDNAGWELLSQLARDAGQDSLADAFDSAHAAEARHLDKVMTWTSAFARSAIGASPEEEAHPT